MTEGKAATDVSDHTPTDSTPITDAHPPDASDVTRYSHYHPGRGPPIATPPVDSDYLRTDFVHGVLCMYFALTKIAI